MRSFVRHYALQHRLKVVCISVEGMSNIAFQLESQDHEKYWGTVRSKHIKAFLYIILTNLTILLNIRRWRTCCLWMPLLQLFRGFRELFQLLSTAAYFEGQKSIFFSVWKSFQIDCNFQQDCMYGTGVCSYGFTEDAKNVSFISFKCSTQTEPT